jgi:hypothetical protein
MSAIWLPANTKRPCSICGHVGWCTYLADGRYEICRRERRDDAIVRQDRAGDEYYLYALGGADRDACDLPATDTAWRESMADPGTLDRAYRAMLDALPLSIDDHAALRTRGLSGERIIQTQYATLPADEAKRRAAVRAVQKELGEYVCAVPGLYRREADSRTYLAGAPGLLVPLRNLEGQIVALAIRVARVRDGGGKYRLMSAPEATIGCGPGSPVHVPRHDGLDPSVVRVTEGAIKAEVATELSGVWTIGIPGVSAWRRILPVIAAVRPKEIRLAWDADVRIKPTVARPLGECARALLDDGFDVGVEVWSLADGKGIDDVLAAGHMDKVNVHVGADACKKIVELQSESGAKQTTGFGERADLARLVPRIQAQPAEAFASDVIAAAAALAEATVEYQRLRSALKHANVPISVWDDTVRKARERAAPGDERPGATGGHERPKSQAQQLLELAKPATLFRTPEGDAYATVPVGKHRETLSIHGKGFRTWLARSMYEAVDRPPSSQDRKSVV